MSLITRILGKSPSPPDAEDARRVDVNVEAAATVEADAAAVARAEEAELAAALASGDEHAIGRWVIEGSSTRIRQQAAQAITDPARVLELIRVARGRDKHVYRILTATRDAQLALERQAQRREAEIAAALEAIEKHADRPVDAGYEATLARLDARWALVVADATENQRDRAATLLQRAHAAATEHRRAREAEAEHQRQMKQAAEERRRALELESQTAAAAAAEQARRIEAERAAERDAARSRREAEDAVVRELLGLLRQARAALDHGGTARALRLRDALKARLPGPPALPPWFERSLQEVDARIEELKDWKTFTVVPKRAELVRRMQSLVGAEMSPEELARQIRRLRDEWRTLHRGAGLAEEAESEREQFDQAAELAYEPCRAHFAQQAAQRKDNQARREDLLARLEAFIASQTDEHTDWRLVEQVLAEARQEWRVHAPVDQEAVKPLQDRFHGLTGGLQVRLREEYARNTKARQSLIERAAHLGQLEDTRQAIDAAKALQQEWKAVGPVRRRDADTLWHEFRRHCDAVFQRSANQAAAQTAALEAGRARALELCALAERRATAGPDEQAAGEDTRSLDALFEEFDALELPRGPARDLRQRFRRALEACEQSELRRRAAAARRGWNDAHSLAAEIRVLALAAAGGLPQDDVSARRTALAAAVAGLEHAPKPVRAALERRLRAIADGNAGTDLDANTVALRLLCVRAELLAGRASPAEDAELRREYQMQRLVAAMGQGERHAPEDLERLELEWLGAGPVEQAVHDALYARFARALGTDPG